jgi:integrase
MWLGGYIREGKKGPTYVIEKWIGGSHFHVSTRCRTERAALVHYARFESDPNNYDPRGTPSADDLAVRITTDLIDEFERYQLKVKRNTKEHAGSVAEYLSQWMEAFDGRDLRTLRAPDLKMQLAKWSTAQRYRAGAIKAFFRWMREEKGLLTGAEDCSRDFRIPPAQPAKLRRKRVVEFEHAEAALMMLRGPTRDVLRVLMATGLHISELRRFAEEGELFAPTPENAKAGVLANLAMKHKSGQLHVVALREADAVDAANRLRAAGSIPAHSQLDAELHAACIAASIPKFGLGVMRHSVATWLARAGVPLPAIADFLGHRSSRTTQLFYRDLGHQALPLPVPAPRLRLVSST